MLLAFFMRLAIVGGTGREGRGLALRWRRAGHAVWIGSRDPDKARARAAELGVEGGDNDLAVQQSEVAILTVPYAAHAETLRALAPSLAGRILVDLTVPLMPPAVTRVQLPPGRAAALEAQEILGAGTRVVAALHHVSSTALADPERAIDCDVLVCADDEEARKTVIALVEDLGTRGLDAGPLANAVALESLTPVLLWMNKRYKATTGIRIEGVTKPARP
jgi:NADPH-dependent F420 reductase